MMGQRMRELREREGWTLREAADELGLRHSTIWMLEENQRGASVETVIRYCETFDCSADWLLGIVDEEE